MKATDLRIEDNLGLTWLVLDGDPAWPLVRRLAAAGYRYIVLPHVMLCQGGAGEDGAKVMAAIGVVAQWRMQECLEGLEHGYTENSEDTEDGEEASTATEGGAGADRLEGCEHRDVPVAAPGDDDREVCAG